MKSISQYKQSSAAEKIEKKKIIRDILNSTWSQLNPNCQAILSAHRDLVTEVLDDFFPGTHRIYTIPREEESKKAA